MKVILCTDNKMGTMFGKRRQSRDGALCRKIADMVGNGRLCLRPYSYSLFSEFRLNIMQDDNYLKLAEKGDFCFVEGDSLIKFEDSIEEVILFKWNRDYPSDVKVDLDLLKGWTLTHTEDFPGTSHEKITMQIYERVRI